MPYTAVLFLSSLVVLAICAPSSDVRTVCVPVTGDLNVAKLASEEYLNNLKCSLVSKEDLLSLDQANAFVVRGRLTPDDLHPLKVVSLGSSDRFVVYPSHQRRSRRDTSEKKPAFFVSTFAVNPKLIHSKAEKDKGYYTVFAKLTEGVLEEYLNDHNHEIHKSAERDQKQIYTGDLFNYVMETAGKLNAAKDYRGRAHALGGRSFKEIFEEFKARDLQRYGEMPTSRPKFSGGKAARKRRALEIVKKGINVVNDKDYVITNPSMVRRILKSNKLFDAMEMRGALVSKEAVEKGVATGRMVVMYTVPGAKKDGSSDEEMRTLLDKSSVLLANIDRKKNPYPIW